MEWLTTDSTMPVRQGDLLVSKFVPGGPAEDMCLIITADCDISQRKFGSQLACLKVISLADYIQSHWGAKKLAKMIEAEAKKLWVQIVKLHSQAQGFESTLTLEASAQWVDREDPQKLCEILQVPEGNREQFSWHLARFRMARAAAVDRGGASPMHLAAEFKATLNAEDIQTVWDELVKQARSEANNMPEGVFMLPTLPHVDGVAGVVILRELIGVKPEKICDQATDARAGDKYLRTGRLPPTIKYAVSQAFGFQYSRIGLSEEYEGKCKDVLNTISGLARGLA